MSTSVLYRALGIRGYKHQSIREQDGGLVLRMRHDGSEVRCPHCGGSNVGLRGTVPRSWHAPPIGRRPVTLFADVPRIECRDCQTEPVVPVPLILRLVQHPGSNRHFHIFQPCAHRNSKNLNYPIFVCVSEC